MGKVRRKEAGERGWLTGTSVGCSWIKETSIVLQSNRITMVEYIFSKELTERIFNVPNTKSDKHPKSKCVKK